MDEKPARLKTKDIAPRQGEMIKPGEMIGIAGMEGWSLADRRMWNLLLVNAWGDRLEDPTADFTIPLRELRGLHDSNDRLRDSLEKLQTTLVSARMPDGKRRTVQMLGGTDIDDDERTDGVLKYDFHRKLVPLLRRSEIYARMEMKVLTAFNSKYSLALYEAIAARVGLLFSVFILFTSATFGIYYPNALAESQISPPIGDNLFVVHRLPNDEASTNIPFLRFGRPVNKENQNLSSFKLRSYDNALHKFPNAMSCLSDGAVGESMLDLFRIDWSRMNSLIDAEVCLARVHNRLHSPILSAQWFEQQGFLVQVNKKERGIPRFVQTDVIAIWQVPTNGPHAGNKSPFSGINFFFRELTALGGVTIGLQFGRDQFVQHLTVGYVYQ